MRIDHHLCIGEVVEGGDRAVPDTDPFLDHLDDRSQAVGGAGDCSQDPVLIRNVLVLVYAVNDVERFIVDRCCDQDRADTFLEVRGDALRSPELTGCLDYELDPGFLPGDFVRILE